MSDTHYFDVDVAKDVGINCAVIFKSFCFWIRKNASEGINCKDGDFWSFASVRGLSELFPYLTEKQIRTAIDTLVEKKYLKKAQLNDNKTNRTLWYSLDELGKSICQIGQMHLPNRANGADQEGKCNIEDNEKKIMNKDISSSLRSEDKGRKRFNPREELFGEGVAGQVISDWLALRKQLKATVTKTAIDMLKREAQKAGLCLEDVMKIMCANGWRGFKAEWVKKDSKGSGSWGEFFARGEVNAIDITPDSVLLG